MYCTNCGQQYPDGSAACPHCGAPTSAAPAPDIRPDFTPSYAPPPAPERRPGSSGASTASLILGILTIALIVVGFFLTYSLGAQIISDFGAGAEITPADVERMIEQGTILTNSLGILLSFGLAMLLALIGLILGIVGVAGEKQRPTSSGRTIGIFGIVINILPLLCCVALLIMGLLAQSGM